MVLMTVHFSLFQAANNAAVMRDVQAHQRGLVSALLNLSRNLGFITGAAVLGAVFATGGMAATFGLAALLIGAAMVAGGTGYAIGRTR
jgi:predicted MFS family arabinose efflux permease